MKVSEFIAVDPGRTFKKSASQIIEEGKEEEGEDSTDDMAFFWKLVIVLAAEMIWPSTWQSCPVSELVKKSRLTNAPSLRVRYIHVLKTLANHM